MTKERIFTIPVSWQMIGELKVPATSLEDAISKAEEMKDPKDFPKGKYVNHSFTVDKEYIHDYSNEEDEECEDVINDSNGNELIVNNVYEIRHSSSTKEGYGGKKVKLIDNKGSIPAELLEDIIVNGEVKVPKGTTLHLLHGDTLSPVQEGEAIEGIQLKLNQSNDHTWNDNGTGVIEYSVSGMLNGVAEVNFDNNVFNGNITFVPTSDKDETYDSFLEPEEEHMKKLDKSFRLAIYDIIKEQAIKDFTRMFK